MSFQKVKHISNLDNDATNLSVTSALDVMPNSQDNQPIIEYSGNDQVDYNIERITSEY